MLLSKAITGSINAELLKMVVKIVQLVIMERVEQEGFNIGYNAAYRGYLVICMSLGIIDPAKVSRSALQNATSIAGMILTTECIVVNK